jgi:Rrf2 family protein
MLSQSVEYALRAACFLADRSPSPQTTGQIAKATKVPAAYLSKILQQLGRAGIVRSQRGMKGGISLMKSPQELTILEVVNAVDPIARIRECPLGLPGHGTRLCPLHRRMDNALADMEEAFGQSTLAEVLAEPTESVPLCNFPHAKARRKT